MSTYRTISYTDIPSTFNTPGSPEPDLKFSIKGIEIDRSTTPKAFDYCVFPPINEFVKSENASIVDGSQESLVLYGSNEVLDFDSSMYETKSSLRLQQVSAKPIGKRSFDSKSPLTVEEMKLRAPGLFTRNISLDDYFSVEKSFSFNLEHYYSSVCTEEKYSLDLFMKPLDYREFAANRQQYVAKFQEIKDSFNILELSCIKLNDTIDEEYTETKSHLKWEILSNSTSNKNFENGRSMFEALLEIKATFQKFIHESDLWIDLNESVHELSDLIIEWNELSPGNSKEVAVDTSDDDVEYVRICQDMKIIELSLCENSIFVQENCSNFNSIVEEVKLIFEEFLHHFRSTKDVNGIFTYEICLFDDHIKEKIRQNSY